LIPVGVASGHRAYALERNPCICSRYLVDQGSVRSRQRYPARVVGGAIAEDLFDRGLCLPSGTAMTVTDLERVVDTILKCKD